MKIFAKRKKSSSSSSSSSPSNNKNDTTTTDNTPHKQQQEEEDTTIKSYFDKAAENQRLNLQQVQDTKLNGKMSSKKKAVVTDITILLTMDPKELNAKQRRLVRREEERQTLEQEASTKSNKTNDKDKDKPSTSTDNMSHESEEKEESSNEKESTLEVHGQPATSEERISNNDKIEKKELEEVDPEKQTETTTMPMPPSLEGLNSKDRRKALRQYERQIEALGLKNNTHRAIELNDEQKKEAQTPESTLSLELPPPPSLEGLNSKDRRKALRDYERQIETIKSIALPCCTTSVNEKSSTENEKSDTNKLGSQSILESLKKEARKIAQKNQRVEESKKNPKKRSLDDTSTNKTSLQSSLQAPSGKKKKKVQDWSHLSPEERERRETQRRMQQEAAERREMEANNGLSGIKRHPLNSERRRANRRKPGKAGLMAAKKKEEKLARDNPKSGSNQHVMASYNVQGFRKRKGFNSS